MHAFLLATGEENKLTPLSTAIAAPMLPIANRPVMAYAVELLARAGFQQSFVSLYQFPESIEHYFGTGQRWKLELHYLIQRQGWGTAGALQRAAHALSELCLVLPADALIDLDIDAAIAFHRQHGGAATVVVSQARCPLTAAIDTVQLDSKGRVQVPTGLMSDQPWYANVGAYLLEPHALAYIPAKRVFNCHPHLLQALVEAGEAVYGYMLDGYWNPLRSFADFQAAQQSYLYGLTNRQALPHTQTMRHLFAEGHEISPGIWCGQGSRLHPTVRLTPPVYIGAHCQIERHVEIGPEVVIGAHTLIDEGVTIARSTVLADSYVGRLIHLEQRIVYQNLLIDVATAAHLRITDQFLLAATDRRLVTHLLRNVGERSLALLLLMVSAPLLLCLSIWIGLTTGQRPFVKRPFVGSKPQIGRNHHPCPPQTIYLYQLRTRTAGQHYTTLGRGLEAWGIQRLPELWHVVHGDLGLVGVKPLTPEEARLVTEVWQQKRYDEQMGFTGLWYTGAPPQSSFDEICIIDAYQAATHTWQSNGWQLLQTPAAWLRRGRSDWQRSPSQPYEEARRPYAQLVNASLGKSTTGDSYMP